MKLQFFIVLAFGLCGVLASGCSTASANEPAADHNTYPSSAGRRPPTGATRTSIRALPTSKAAPQTTTRLQS